MTTDLQNELRAHLAPVCRRLQWRSALHDISLGLIVGAAMAALAAVCRIFTGGPLGRVLVIGGLLVLVAGPLLACLWAMTRKFDWQQAAQVIDERNDLQDRTLTAWEFATATQPTVPQQLQIRDTLLHLKQIAGNNMVPLTLPRLLPAASGLFVLAACLLLWPQVEQPVDSEVNAESQSDSRPQLSTAPALEISAKLAINSQQQCRIERAGAVTGPSESIARGQQSLIRNYFQGNMSQP